MQTLFSNLICGHVMLSVNGGYYVTLWQGNIMSTNVNGITARVTREAGRPSTTKTITQTDILGWIVILSVPTLISSVLYRVSSIIHLSWIQVSTFLFLLFKNLNIMTWNATGFISSASYLCDALKDNAVDICGISEHFLFPNNVHFLDTSYF